MKKITKISNKPSTSANNTEKNDEIIFSFKYLTQKSDYNFENLDRNKKKEWQSAFAERIFQISRESWLAWQNKPKETGIETIPASQLHFLPHNYTFSKDEKVIVFRFNSQKGRIIGVKENNSSTFCIMGFDTDFTAYKH